MQDCSVDRDKANSNSDPRKEKEEGWIWPDSGNFKGKAERDTSYRGDYGSKSLTNVAKEPLKLDRCLE